MLSRYVNRSRSASVTVNHPLSLKKTFSPQRLRQSYSSSGSTDSLLSILGHDSCPSVTSEDEKGNGQGDMNMESVDSRLNLLNLDTDSRVNMTKAQGDTNDKSNSKNEKDCKFSNENGDDHNSLTPWQQWMLKKTQIARTIRLNAKKKKKEEQLQKQEIFQNENEKKVQVLNKQKEWLSRKNRELKLQKKLEKQKQATEEDLKRIEQQELQLKADRIFREWMDKKRQEELMRKRAEEAENLKNVLERVEKQKKAEEKYNEWLYRLKHQKNLNKEIRKPLVRSSSTGKMPSLRMYPAPGYINPNPWMPVCPPSSPRRQKKSSSEKSKAAKSHSCDALCRNIRPLSACMPSKRR